MICLMKYKAIALDLDGTLLNSKKEVSNKNKEIIMKAAKAGVKIILASGRPVPGIKKIAKQLHLEEEAQLDPPVKFLCVGDHKVLRNVEAKLNEKFNGTVNVFFSEPYFLEIMPQGIEKASSLEILLGSLGIDRKHLIACGDGFNDIPMMRYAGLSVAMANAQDETKEWADFIAPSNDEDGVAVAIEKFIELN